MNPSRRGFVGQLTAYVTALGVDAITGKPYKPTTQGKNERFHQTLFRYLDKQPLADTLEQLQTQVDEFDRIYNTERPHQSLPGRITPQQAWDATPKADPPRPRPDPAAPLLDTEQADTVRAVVPTRPGPPRTQPRVTRIRANGSLRVRRISFQIGSHLAGQTVHVIENPTTVAFADPDGTILLEQPWPTPGTTYVSNGQPRGPRTPTNPSPKS